MLREENFTFLFFAFGFESDEKIFHDSNLAVAVNFHVFNFLHRSIAAEKFPCPEFLKLRCIDVRRENMGQLTSNAAEKSVLILALNSVFLRIRYIPPSSIVRSMF